MNVVAHFLVERAYRADHFHLVGNDVETVAAVDPADRYDCGLLGDVDLAADNGLQSEHDLRGDHDWIHTRPRRRAMGLAALHGDAHDVGGRHDRARAIGDRVGLDDGRDVETEDHVGMRIFHRALFHHEGSSAFLTGRRAFLRGLEQEFDGAGQPVLYRRQGLRHAHQDRNVGIVAAGVHHAGFLAGPDGSDFRCERQVHFLVNGQRIHVGAQRNDRTGFAALEQRHNAGMRHAGADFESQRPEVLGNDSRGTKFAIAEFGIAVDVMPPFDDFRFELIGQPVEVGADVRRESGVGSNRQDGGGETCCAMHGLSLLLRLVWREVWCRRRFESIVAPTKPQCTPHYSNRAPRRHGYSTLTRGYSCSSCLRGAHLTERS